MQIKDEVTKKGKLKVHWRIIKTCVGKRKKKHSETVDRIPVVGGEP